ncbi:MarR family transcriptional regulator [Nocardia terpenica]|uniref:MarR family transcriptional regulator n=1 Tax=Nocardia terpenica TaxID=455432 RepID=A0A291RXK3_9NOCA|nr:MarR family transcriptional regulator [Nocardia terpenica]
MGEDQPLGYQVARLAMMIRTQIGEALTPLNLTFPQYVCLRVLKDQPGKSNAGLARSTRVSPQSMHAVLQPLEDAGLVERPASVEFGRARPIHLTPRGTEVLTRAENAVHSAETRLLSHLSPRQQNEFKRALATLTALDIKLTEF